MFSAADGGIVGRDAFLMPRDVAGTFGGGASSGPPIVKLEVINENGSQITTREVPDGRGGRKQQMVVGDAFVTGAGTPQGQRSMAENYGLRPRPVTR